VSLPPLSPDAGPLDFVNSILKEEPFADHAEWIISRSIHSLLVRASEGVIEVRDCFG
jgi:hypothetical protein